MVNKNLNKVKILLAMILHKKKFSEGFNLESPSATHLWLQHRGSIAGVCCGFNTTQDGEHNLAMHQIELYMTSSGTTKDISAIQQNV
jgi:hypothetical protein